MLLIYFVCSGGGLRTTFFAGFIRGLLDGLKRVKKTYTVEQVYTVSGSALTVPLAFVLKDYEALEFLEDFSYADILTQKAKSFNEAKIYHGFFDFTKDFRSKLQKIISRLGNFKSKFYVTRLIYPSLKHEFKRITVDYALDSARLPVVIVPRPLGNGKLAFDGGIGQHVPIKLLSSKKRFTKKSLLIICINKSPPLRQQLLEFRKIFGSTFIAKLARLYMTDPVIKEVLKINNKDNSHQLAMNLFSSFPGVSILLKTTGLTSLLPADENKLYILYNKGRVIGFKVGKEIESYNKLELAYAF